MSAAFQSSAFQQNAFQSLANVSVTVTGVSATGEVGTATASIPVIFLVTGEFATGFVETVSVFGGAIVAPTGPPAAGEIGDVSVTGSAIFSVTGVFATGGIGDVSVIGNAIFSVTGVFAAGELGDVSATGGAVATITGVFATGEIGDVSVIGNAIFSVTGVFAAGELGDVSATGGAIFSVTGVYASGEINSVSISIGGGIDFSVTGVSAAGGIGDVSVSEGASASVTGVATAGEIGFVTILQSAVVSPSGVVGTSALADVTVFLFNGVNLTGVFATGFVGTATTWISVDDRQICSWVQVPINAGGSWTTIDIPCSTQIDVTITLFSLFATGGVGEVTVTLATPIPLSNANLLSTGQIGTVIVPLGVSGVEATGVVEDVDVITPTGELISLLRAWSVYDIYGEASIGFPNYQDAQVFEGSQAPLVTPLNVWADYFNIGVSSTQTKNTEYSLLYYTYGYEELGGQAVYEYPYSPPVSDTIVYFNSITGDYTQELWVYLSESSPAPEGIYYNIINGNGDASNFPLISAYELFVNDTYELVFSIWIDAADYYSPTYTISGGTVPLDEWVHLAVSRSSNVIRIFINGVSVGTITYSGPIPNTPALLSVSSIITPLIESTGASIYTDSFRWINGLALYTSNFTPPAYLSPYFSDVVGLYMVGSVGDVYVDAPELLSLVRPWSGGLGSTSSYPNFTVANINGGANIGSASDVFDGVQAPQITPDYLWFGDYTPTYINYNTTIVKNYNYSVRFPGTYGGSIATNTPPRGDDLGFYYGFDSRAFVEFTCEMWVYVSSTNFPSAGVTLMQLYSLEEFSATITLKINSARELQFQVYDNPSFDYVVDISGGTVPLNSWVHLAVSRGSSSTQIFINGTVVASTAYNWNTYNTGYALGLISSVGYSVPTTYVYLDSFRLIGNGGLYTSNFTPPAYLPNYPQSDEVFGLYMVTSVGTVTVPEP